VTRDLSPLVWKIAPIAVLVIAGGIWISYCSGYFFLFDDFALVGESAANSVSQILTLPLIGFYRPAVFLIVKGEAQLFGWAFPAGYLAVSCLIHLLNAGLVYRVAGQLGGTRRTSAMAAVLFVLSPWSTEAHAWLSAGFDVISTFGLLSCVLAGLLCIRTATLGRGVAIAVAGICSAALALFSKEGAVVVPLVAATSLVFARSPDDTRRGLGWVYVAGLVFATAGYLTFRGQMLPNLGGAYGNAYTLFRDARVVDNALHNVRAFFTVPFPGVRPGVMPPLWALLAAAAASIGALWFAVRTSPRTVVFSVISFCVAIAPTLWMALPVGSSSGGRLLYFPGVWVCLIVAGGMSSLAEAADRRLSAWMRAAVVAAVVGIYGLSLVSVGYQLSLWHTATSLSRSSIEQFAPLLARGVPSVFIPNLPFWLAEGPYVLKDYAFSFYFEGQTVPTVRTRNMVLSREHGRVHFVGWTNGETAPLGHDEAVLRLALPIDRIPAPMVLRPENISVLVTLRANKPSDATVALDAPEVGDWHVESPAPDVFAVEPAQGNGSATIRIVPHAMDATLDRAFSVPVWAGHNDRAQTLALLKVRIRTTTASGAAPPFGSVDLPADPIVVGSAPVVLQGWALDDVSFRRVWAEGVDERGHRSVIAASVARGGERRDVSKAFPNAHDLFNAGWAIAIEPAVLVTLRPSRIDVLAEDGDGNKAVVGTRRVQWFAGQPRSR